MQPENKRIDGLNIAYIGGGSRGWAWGFMIDLAMEPQLSGTVRLYDIDQNAAGKNKLIGEKISALPEAKAHWRYQHARTLAEALDNADFVVISILPGTFEEMRSDVHAPEQLGIYQPVGDTVGPGGLVRALRTIPMFAEIGEAIRKHSPDAWVINYTNPMSLCVRTLYEVFPRIKAFGCCHEVFGTQKLLAVMLEDLKGVKGVTRQEIQANVMGINHFTWFDRASWQDVDLMPLYTEFAEKYHETGFAMGQDSNWMNDSFRCGHRVKFDLFRRYGLIAAAGDRHLAEFMPPWYVKNPETVKEWQFGLTTVDWRVEDLRKRLARADRLASGEESFDLSGSGEEGLLLMKALLGLGQLVSNVNIPNMGQIANLPTGSVVETNALFRRDEIAPVQAGAMPGNIWALTVRHVANQENTLRAALDCNFRLALTSLLNDPLMAAVSPVEGDALLRRMLGATAKYLPTGWKAYCR